MAIGRTSLLWVEGNTNITVPKVTEETTFNVDDPTFWPPLSVLSGLASGYCERRAVLNNTFVTGAGTSLIWNQEGTGAVDVANRATIVSNCMHNMALGSDMNHLFYNADATMAPFGSAAAAASNYMTTMDSAIAEMIDPAAANHYVTATGTTYANFGAVATAAVTTATAAGSAIQMPVQGGGTTLKTTGGNAIPVEWAKERKWMLDELSWISVQGATVREYEADAHGNLSLLNSANAGGVERATAQAAYNTITGATEWRQDTSYPLLYAGLTTSYAVTEWRTGMPLMGVPTSATLQATYYDNSEQQYEPSNPDVIVYKWATSNNTTNPSICVVANGGTVFVTTPNALTTNTTAKVFAEQGTPCASPNPLDYTAHIIDGNSTAESNKTLYKVIAGGTLHVPSGVNVGNVIVHSDGCLDIQNGGYVDCCTMLSGGTFTGIPNIRIYNTDDMFVDPQYQTFAGQAANFNVIAGATVSISDNTAITGNRVYYVKDGGLLTVSAAYTNFFLGQHNYATTDDIKAISGIVIGDGGRVVVKGTPKCFRLIVVAQSDPDPYGEYIRNKFGDYKSGNTSYYCWSLVNNSGMTSPPSNVYTLYDISYISTQGLDGLQLYNANATEIPYDIDSAGSQDYAYTVTVTCPVVVLPGGRYEQGLGVWLGWSDYSQYYGSLEGCFVAYPGSTVSLATRSLNGEASDGIKAIGWYGGDYTFTISNETVFTLYRMTENTYPVSADAYNYNFLVPCHLAGTAYIHVCNTTTTTFTTVDITGATFTAYAEQDLLYSVGGTTASKASYDAEHPFTMDRDTLFDTARLFVFNANGLKTTGESPTLLVEGINNVDVSATALAGIVCKKLYNTVETSALYYKTITGGTWTLGGTGTAAAWPATLYTTQETPARGASTYTDAACELIDGSTVFSFAYPVVTGSEITLPDIPAENNNQLYARGVSTDVFYRCALADVVLETTAAEQLINHYTEFYVRQKAT